MWYMYRGMSLLKRTEPLALVRNGALSVEYWPSLSLVHTPYVTERGEGEGGK